MKRSSRKQFRTLLALSAVLVLLAISLTGCFGKGNTDGPDPSETGAPQTSEPTSTAEPSEPSEPSAPVTSDPGAVMGTVNTGPLNVRSDHDETSAKVEQLEVGTRVTILEQKLIDSTHWGRVESGWINLRYVTPDDETTWITYDASSDATVPEPTTAPADDKKDDNTASNTTTNNTTKGTTGTITASTLNIRSGPGTSYKSAGSLKKGDTVTVYEKSGNWGRTDKGWISLKYVKLDGTVSDATTSTDKKDETGTVTDVVNDKNTTILGYGVVKISALNVRTGPGTKYAKVATVTSGQRLPYYQKSGSWVRLEKGWVSCSSEYFNIENGGVSAGSKGTITASELNIRKEANKTSDKVGTYKKGDAVEILEVSGNWGKTDKGWISLTYVSLSGSTSSSTSTSTTITAGTKVTITASSLHIRKEANKTSESLGEYKKGETVEILEVSGNWGRTSKGWISLTYAKAN